jgi:hypothetical protein
MTQKRHSLRQPNGVTATTFNILAGSELVKAAYPEKIVRQALFWDMLLL